MPILTDGLPKEKERLGHEKVWQTPPTCESCPLFISAVRNADDPSLTDGLCAKDTERLWVHGRIHWCGSHPQHAAMLAILAQAAAERIAKPSGRNGIITTGGLNL